MNLLEAIAGEVMRKLYEIEPQSLGILADARLRCKADIEQALRPHAERFAELLPRSLEAPKEDFLALVRELRVDNFGAWGTRYILEHMGLEEPGPDFVTRAKEAILRAGDAETVLQGTALVHRRVFAYGEYRLYGPKSLLEEGAMARENGRRRSEAGRLKALASPISNLVDRSLCSEFQIMASCLELTEAWPEVRGSMEIFVSTSPCVSCLWALRQCQCYWPKVRLGVVNGEEVLAPSLRGV